MELLQYALALIVTLGVLVSIHELGHFVIARASGVKVLRFAVGFGTPIWSRTDRRGTEFAIAAIPLGGYVRMCDEQDLQPGQELAPGELTYNQLTPWWRIAIALGGPVANFLLAIVVYWCLFVAGTLTAVPMLGVPAVESVAEQVNLPAHVKLVEVDGEPVQSWQQIGMALASRLGDTGSIELGVTKVNQDRVMRYQLPISEWHQGSAEPDLFGSLGLAPVTLPIVGQVVAESAAERGGLLKDDRVVAVGGESVSSWRQLVGLIEKSPNQELSLLVERNAEQRLVDVTPDARGEGEAQRGFLGIGPPAPTLVQYSFLQAFPAAVNKTKEVTGMTLNLLRKMIVGQVSVKNLSGPITIAQVAGDSAKVGWRTFIGVLALLSVSLGVLNLLPIPILDGGHIMFCVAELLTGRPVSERVQALGLQVGLVLVGGLMFMAIYNDIARLL